MIAYCIRHGESAFNAEGRIQGQQDPPLSEHGARQARALAETFADAAIDAIYCSPLSRARQTAEPIAQVLGLQLQFDDRLREIHAGIFQGMLWTEIQQQHPEEAQRWQGQEPDFVVPGGESRRDLMRRGGEVLTEVLTNGHANAIVVSHGGLLAGAFKALLGIPAERNPFALHNASITRVGWDGRFRLDSLNETAHLIDAGAAPRPWGSQ